MKRKILTIPGLGYDARLFQNLDLIDHEIQHLTWIEPKPKESLSNYAIRMFEDVRHDNSKIVIIGHSFGGILAQEFAKTRELEAIFLISSIRSRTELPMYFKLIRPLRMHRLFSKKLSILTIPFWGNMHDFRSKKEKQLFKQMVSNYSKNYLQWALRSLSGWVNSGIPKNIPIFQIHGSKDRTFPFRKINAADEIIQGGSHLIVLKNSAAVSSFINQKLGTL